MQRDMVSSEPRCLVIGEQSGGGQSGKQEHLVSKSLWIWPLKVGILGSSITVLRITVEKVNQIRNGTMVLYLEHVLY